MGAPSGPQSSVWEQLFEEIDAGRCFLGGAQKTGNAGQFGIVQLFNPAGSTKIVQVAMAWGGNAAAANIQIFFGSSAAPLFQWNGRNMKAGGASSVAEIRSSVTGAVPATLNSEFFVAARQMQPIFSVWGAQFAAGQGMYVTSAVVAQNVAAHFQWIETDV